jgi:1,4-dihydroxy-2-naphthoate octaprenyltransferase
MDFNHLKISPQGSVAFLHFAGFRYWTASLLPALVGTTLPFWLDSPAFSFRWLAATEFLLATVLVHAGFSFLQASFDDKSTRAWTKSRLQRHAAICFVLACLLGLHINNGLTFHTGVPKCIFILYGITALFVGALYVVPPLNFYSRVGGEFVIAVGLGMMPVLGAYLVQVGDLTRTVYLASLPLFVATGLWVWVDELATSVEDEKSGRRTLAIDFGARFSGRYGTLALSGMFFATLVVAVISTSLSPFALTTLLLVGIVWKIVITSWKEYSHPEKMVTLKRHVFRLHLVTCIIFAITSLIASPV